MKDAFAVSLWHASHPGGRSRRGPAGILKATLHCAAIAIFVVALAANAQTPKAAGSATPAQAQIVQPVSHTAADLSSAPRSPEFLKFLESERAGNLPVMETVRGHSLGYIPEPMELSHLKSRPAFSPLMTGTLPSSYDLRTTSRMTPVRDQANCGSCWAFGTFGSAESLLKPTEARDFSENNLKNLAGFDRTPCSGGNFQMSSAYLARWSGPVNETGDPYKDTDDRSTSPANLPAQKHVQQIIFLPGRNSATDNDQIKAAIMTRGAVAVSMFMDESPSYLNTATWSYYYNDPNATTTNHAVTAAGWDDNYSKTNFAQTPPGNGAFLIKNSWGSTWGNAGYFWVSYYSAQFITGWAASFGGALPTTGNYAHRYEYDTLGWVGSIGAGEDTLWYANIFKATEAGYLDAVSTYIASNNSPYTLSIYKGVTGGNPISGTQVFTDSGTAPYAGYQMFTVNPVHLVNGDTFSVVVKLTTPGTNWPAPAQYFVDGYSSSVTSATGRSFYSFDGASWGDIVADFDSTLSWSLKAFTAADSATPTTKPTFTPAAGTYTTAQNVTITAPAGATIYYTLDGSAPSVFSSVYSSPILVYSPTTIRAIATMAGHSTSAMAVAKYTMNLPQAATPTIKPPAGTYGMSRLVILTPVTPGTSVYYTTDGSTPTMSSTKYTSPIGVNASVTIKAMAASTNYGPSPVVTAAYKFVPSPATMTGLAASVTTTTAILKATANNFGAAGQFWFQWGTTPALGNATTKTTLPAANAMQSISTTLPTLTTKTTYYFRPMVSNVGGTTYGATQNFTTK